MTKIQKFVLLIFIMGLLILLLRQKLTQPVSPIATSAPLSSPANSDWETQVKSGGNVTVTVTPQTLITGKNPQFTLEFNTHSVELDFDIAQLAKLTDDFRFDYGKPTWDGSPASGHHRKGVLTFPTVLKPQSQRVSLVLTDIAQIPSRVFSWKVR